MNPKRILVLALVLLTGCSDAAGDLTGPGVVTSDVRFPVLGAAYHGSSPHLFSGGAVSLACGTHGVFSTSVEPPLEVGGTARSEYSATFVGELVLEPPVVSSTITHPLEVPAVMAESIVLTSDSGDRRVYTTELVTFQLADGMPDGVVVRESPDLVSAGPAVVTPTADGLHRVEAHYDVWLEISLDGGRSWEPAEAAVRMTLEEG